MSGDLDKCQRSEISDSDLEKYVNEAFTEEVIRGYENQMLSVMKHRQEKYPSEKNDREWLAFTNFVCRRRCQSGAVPTSSVTK